MISAGRTRFDPAKYSGIECPSPKSFDDARRGCRALEESDITGDNYFQCIRKGSAKSRQEGQKRKDGKKYVHDVRGEASLDEVKKSLSGIWSSLWMAMISQSTQLMTNPRKLPDNVIQRALDTYRISIRTGMLGAGYCFDNGKIYSHQGLLPFKAKKAKRGQDRASFCPTRDNGELVDRDCSCAVKDGGKECKDLDAAKIEVLQEAGVKKHAGVKALYFKYYEVDSKGEVSHLAAPVLVAIPKEQKPQQGMKPAKLKDLKKFLSSRNDDGEIKLFAELKAQGIARSTEKTGKGDDDDYTYYLFTGTGLTDYLASKNTYDPKVHGNEYAVQNKPSYYLSFDDAKALLNSINSDPKILADNNDQPLLDESTIFITKKTSTGATFVFNCQPQVLNKIVLFLGKQIEAKNQSMSLKAAMGLKKYLENSHIVRAYRAPDMQKDLSKDQKKMIQKEGAASRFIMYLFQTPALLVGIGSLLIFGLMIRMNRRQARQMHEPEVLKRELDIKAAKKRLRSAKIKQFFGKKLTPKEELKVKEDLQLVLEGNEEKKMADWQQQLKQLALRGEVTTESERELLKLAPDWLVAGRDEQVRKFILAIRNSGENAHPMVYGPSGSGKSYVQIGASNWLSAAWMWKYEPEKVKAALKKKYVDDPEKARQWAARAQAINAIFAKYGIERRYPETGQGMYEMQIKRYEKIAAFIQNDDLDRLLATMDNTKLQTGTMYRGKQADKNASLVDAGEHRAVPNLQEVYELLKAGSTGGGGEGIQDSESMGNLLKHAMGAEDRGKLIRQLQGLPPKSINLSADTTADRALRMARDEKTHDLNRRWAWIECNAWSPKETLEYMLDPGVIEKLELEKGIKIDPWAIEHAVRLGTKLMAPAGSGTLPRMAAARIINDGISLLKEQSNGSTGPHTLTPDHIVAIVRREGKTVEGDVRTFGMEAMDLAAEHFVRPQDVRAMKDIKARRFSSALSDAAYEKLVTLELLKVDRNAHPLVKRIALSIINFKALGDYEDNKVQETKEAVVYARKLFEKFMRTPEDQRPNPNDAGEWAAFVNTGIEDVRPIDSPELYADTILQEQIIRAMTPYKYASPEEMGDVARMIEHQVIAKAMELGSPSSAGFMSPDSAEGYLSQIPTVMDEFERGHESLSVENAITYAKNPEDHIMPAGTIATAGVDPQQLELFRKAELAARQANQQSLLMNEFEAKNIFAQQPHILNMMTIEDGVLLMPGQGVTATNDFLRATLAQASNAGGGIGTGGLVTGGQRRAPTQAPAVGITKGGSGSSGSTALVPGGGKGIMKK